MLFSDSDKIDTVRQKIEMVMLENVDLRKRVDELEKENIALQLQLLDKKKTALL